jgi:integrase
VRISPNRSSGRSEYRDYHRKWTGEDLADFIQISYFTGLRISDGATFDISRLTPAGEVKLRATKNGNCVSVWIPEWLRSTIRVRAGRIGPRIFGEHTTTDINVITDVSRRKLNALWAKAGPWEQKPTHHRFRHTFVRILLEHHVPPSVIAELVGDTEQMIRKHYSAWMPKRQENIRRMLAEAFRDVPRFHGC